MAAKLVVASFKGRSFTFSQPVEASTILRAVIGSECGSLCHKDTGISYAGNTLLPCASYDINLPQRIEEVRDPHPFLLVAGFGVWLVVVLVMVL